MHTYICMYINHEYMYTRVYLYVGFVQVQCISTTTRRLEEYTYIYMYVYIYTYTFIVCIHIYVYITIMNAYIHIYT